MSSPISNVSSAQPQSPAAARGSVTPLNGGNPAGLLPFGDLLANQQALLQQLLAAGDGGELPAVLGELMQQGSDGELDLEALAEELEAADIAGTILPPDGKLLPASSDADVQEMDEAQAAIGGVAAALFGWRQLSGGEAADTAAVGNDDAVATKPTVAAVALNATQAGDAELANAAESAEDRTTGLQTASRSQPLAVEAARGEFAATIAATKGEATAEGVERTANDIADLGRLTAARSGAADSRSPTLQLSISQHAVDDPAWSEAVGARIHWMAGNGVQNATLKLNPEELGGIQVQLNMQGDKAAVQFQTQHQDTRDLIEKMLPRLNHAMEQQGMRLEEVKVSHQPSWGEASQQQAQQQSQQSSGRSGSGFAQLHTAADTPHDGEGGSAAPTPRNNTDGTLDAYA